MTTTAITLDLICGIIIGLSVGAMLTIAIMEWRR